MNIKQVNYIMDDLQVNVWKGIPLMDGIEFQDPLWNRMAFLRFFFDFYMKGNTFHSANSLVQHPL